MTETITVTVTEILHQVIPVTTTVYNTLTQTATVTEVVSVTNWLTTGGIGVAAFLLGGLLVGCAIFISAKHKGREW